MKKMILVIICFVIIFLSIFGVKFINYRAEKNKIKQENLEYETYLNKQILGTELTTFINKATDNNEKNKVPKNDKGYYIQNDTNSIEIEI